MSNVDILALAKEAQIAKQKNPSAIDATIGMFFDDDRQMIIPQVKAAFNKIDVQNIFPYGTPSGGPQFEGNLIDWVFDDQVSFMQDNFLISALATPGGSGALSVFFGTYGTPGESVLISDIRWRYDFFTDAANLKIKSFKLFENDHFNLVDFKAQLDILTKQQHRVMVVINDPCHNPTGYQLSAQEWQSIIEILNIYDKNDMILIYDLAYFDFDPNGRYASRANFAPLKALKSHVSVLIAFSASKSFAIYGIRLGGAIGLFKTKEQQDYFKKKAHSNALGKWSAAPSVGIEIFNQLTTREQKPHYLPYVEKLTQILKNRGDIFISEAKASSLDLYPYKGGFFVLVKSSNPLKHVQSLIEKEAIYLIPMAEGIRIALCSITTEEVKGLADKIAQIVNGQ